MKRFLPKVAKLQLVIRRCLVCDKHRFGIEKSHKLKISTSIFLKNVQKIKISNLIFFKVHFQINVEMHSGAQSSPTPLVKDQVAKVQKEVACHLLVHLMSFIFVLLFFLHLLPIKKIEPRNNMNCPKCKAVIANENINMQTDIAHCTNCDNFFKISENIISHNDKFDMNDPPKGAWIKNDINQITIGATTRSPLAFFLVPFMMVWSGFSLSGIYGAQIISGHFNPFLSLFGIPFLIGSIIFWALALMAIWGKVEIVTNNQEGEIFTGISKIGFRKKFLWSEVSSIREDRFHNRNSRNRGNQILIEGKRRITFGSGLSAERMYYLLKSLQKIQLQFAKGSRFY